MAPPLSRATVPMSVPEGARMLEALPTAQTGRIVHTPPHPHGPTDRTREHNRYQPCTRWPADLAALELDDPTGAVEHFARARALRAQAATVKAEAASTTVSADQIAALAAGELDPAARLEVRDIDPEQANRERDARRAALHAAADAAITAGKRAIYEAGDTIVTDLLGPVIAECLAAPHDLRNQQRYELAAGLLDYLRTSALIPTAEGAGPLEYRFARPDLVHLHQLREAREARYVGHYTVDDARPGLTVAVHRRPIDAPPVTLADIGQHPEWEPGCFTAAQVLEHSPNYVHAPAAEPVGA